MREGDLVASFRSETGLLRDAAFNANESYFSFVDPERAYLIDLQPVTPVIVHRQDAAAGLEYRSTGFGPNNTWGLGSIQIERPARRSSATSPSGLQPPPNTPGAPFRAGRAKVIVQLIDLNEESFQSIKFTWWRWLHFWNHRSPEFKLQSTKIYVDSWLALLEGELS